VRDAAFAWTFVPEVFEMGDGTARVKVEVVPPDVEGDCCDAAEQCPSEAIKIHKP
jgi:ferredoxin